MEQNWNFLTYYVVLHFGKMKDFVLDAVVLPHVLNKNVHIFCKIRSRVALASVLLNCDIKEKYKN